MTKVRTRFAPSPTGFLHVGSLRTALYNYLIAKQANGSFILRIEDTDQTRLVDHALENIVESLYYFGLTPDEGPVWENEVIVEKGEKGPYLQSKRLDLYKKYAEELVSKKHAYYCFCTTERLQQLRESQEAQKLPPKYDKFCFVLPKEEIEKKLAAKEKHAIRLNVPKDKLISFTDLVYGDVKISSNDIDDQVLLKSDGFPTYHLAVVVDDHLMEITHAVRGEEWIPSTPKHILLYSAFGWESPKYVHLPLLLSKSRKKLSKRENDVAVKDFLSQGYLPDALLNFIALLGWNPKSEQEIFSLDQLIKEFDIKKINKSGAVFDLDKLDWINGTYIRKLSVLDLYLRLKPFLTKAGFEIQNFPEEFLLKIVKLEQERLKKLSEIGDRVAYFFKEPEYDGTLLVWKKSNGNTIKKNLELIKSFLEKLEPKMFGKENLEHEIKTFITEKGLINGEVLWPLRVSLSGLAASPGPFEIMDAFAVLPNGKEIILNRITQAISKL